MATIAVITVVNDEGGEINKEKSCGACVFFETTVRLELEELARKGKINVVIWNQQSFGVKNMHEKVPDVLRKTSAWYPKFVYFDAASWEKVSADKKADVPFDLYNGEKDEKGIWKLRSRPMIAKNIVGWAVEKLTGKAPAATHVHRADPLDEIVVVGSRWQASKRQKKY